MEIDIDSIREKSSRQKKENQKFLERLRTKNPRKLDAAVRRLRDEVFEETDCLTSESFEKCYAIICLWTIKLKSN